MPPATLTRLPLVPRPVEENLSPIARLHEELARSFDSVPDAERARRRYAAGAVAFDPLALLEALDAESGRCLAAYEYTLDVMQQAGLALPTIVAAARGLALPPLLSAWLVGDRLPTHPARRLGRQSAALVGNAALGAAATTLHTGAVVERWTRPHCPCCGSPPDLALRGGDARVLVCARCDTAWHSTLEGCLGCGTSAPPAFARVTVSMESYTLLICNACGRYLKERPVEGALSPFLERAVSGQLDSAAERRGLRL